MLTKKCNEINSNVYLKIRRYCVSFFVVFLIQTVSMECIARDRIDIIAWNETNREKTEREIQIAKIDNPWFRERLKRFMDKNPYKSEVSGVDNSRLISMIREFTKSDYTFSKCRLISTIPFDRIWVADLRDIEYYFADLWAGKITLRFNTKGNQVDFKNLKDKESSAINTIAISMDLIDDYRSVYALQASAKVVTAMFELINRAKKGQVC